MPQGFSPDGEYERGELPPNEWNLHAIQRILWQRRWLVLAIAVEVFIIAALVTFLRTPLYEASARVLIERSMPKILDSEDVVPVAWNQFEIERFYQTQYLLVKDPAVLVHALDRDGLRETLLHELLPDEPAEGQAAPSDENLAEYIRQGLTIQQLEYSNVIKVSFRHPNPDVAAMVVNGVVNAYQEFFVETGREAREGASRFLEEQIREAKAELFEIEAGLNEERAKLGATLTQEGSEMNENRLVALDQELTRAKTARAQAEATLSAFENSQPMGLELVRNDPRVRTYREDLVDLGRQVAELEGRVGPDWPRLKELRRAREETQRNLDAAAWTVYEEAMESARAQRELAQQNEKRLDELFARELQVATATKTLAKEYDAARREYEQKRSALERLLTRREEVAVTADLDAVLKRQVSIVAEARPPASPAVPRVKLSLALGLAFGLFLGVAAAFLAEALDNKVRHAAQLGEISNLPVLGSVPRVDGPARPRLAFAKKARSGSPVLAAQQNDAEEAFRAIRSSLLLSKPDHPPTSLLVTSALPSEGKSTVAANLARTLAAFGSRTVIIDADLRHRRLHRVFKVPRDRGLTNVLATSEAVENVVFKTRFPNLYVIPGGPCPPDPATLLQAESFRRTMRDLRERLDFDFVIIDTPPALVFADTLSLIPAVEGVLVVARALRTTKDALRDCVGTLRKINAPLTGVVLNAEVGDERSGSYYRYYHYRRDYYRKAAEARQKAGETGPVEAEASRSPRAVESGEDQAAG